MAVLFYRDDETTSIPPRNVRLKIRVSVLEEMITLRGALQKRPGRERRQEKLVKDMPVMELILPEYNQRFADAIKVLTKGWELQTQDPVECWMGDLILNATAQTLEMSAKVDGHNIETSCGFYLATNEQLDNAIALVADESPVQSDDETKISYTLDVSLLGGLDLYILPYATDVNKTAYGIVKHIELPNFPV